MGDGVGHEPVSERADDKDLTMPLVVYGGRGSFPQDLKVWIS